MTVNDKSNLTSVRISHDIDRCVCIVDKAEILISFCNGSIHRRFYIIDDHRMVGTLCDLQLSPKYRQIQGGGYLTDTAAIGFHNVAHFIGGRRSISVLFIERHNRLLHGKFFARIKNRSVDQFRSSPDVLFPVGIAAGIVGTAASQSIMNQGKLFRVALRLIHIGNQHNAAVPSMPFFRHVIDNFFHRSIRIDHISVLPFMNNKTAVLQRQAGVYRLRIHRCGLIFNHTAHCLRIHGKLQFQNFRSCLFQMALYTEPFQDISSLSRKQCLAGDVRIRIGQSQVPGCDLDRLVSRIELNS